MTQSPLSPLVSVLMPVHNAAPFVVEAIRSILNQSYTHFELLVCDDGSTDASLACIQTLQDPRLRVLSHPTRKGIPSTRNLLLDQAHGAYLAWLDADDLAHSERLQMQVTALQSHPAAAFCVGNAIFLSHTHKHVQKLPPDHKMLRTILNFKQVFAFSSCMLNKEHLNGLRFDETLQRAEDWALLSQLAQDHPFCFVPQILVTHRITPSENKPDFEHTEAYLLKVFGNNCKELLPHFADESALKQLIQWLRSPQQIKGVGLQTALATLHAICKAAAKQKESKAFKTFYQYQVLKAIYFHGIKWITKIKFYPMKGVLGLLKSRI